MNNTHYYGDNLPILRVRRKDDAQGWFDIR
jgi:hypothetical protein